MSERRATSDDLRVPDTKAPIVYIAYIVNIVYIICLFVYTQIGARDVALRSIRMNEILVERLDKQRSLIIEEIGIRIQIENKNLGCETR